MRLLVAAAALLLLWVTANGAVQLVRKPSELMLPVSGRFYKTPAETWRAYGALFRRHATEVTTPELLAALAQVEASGNPMARTYWRWRWSLDPFEVYRPASSAVGLFQITDGTFARAKRYCIHDHRVVEEGPWHDWDSCWLNELYLRLLPSHAIELTSAWLTRGVTELLARGRVRAASPKQKQRLAVLIHVCGDGAARRLVRRGLEVPAGLRCGDHRAAGYLQRVEKMQKKFAALAAKG